MDVQTLGPAATPAPTLSLSPNSDPSAGAPAAPGVSAGVQAGGLTPFPGADQSQTPPQSAASHLPSFTLPHEVAKIFVGSAANNVQVSFKVVKSPNEIVTVFKDSSTGEIVSQFPSEIMIKIAEFFDQVAGVVLDKHA